MDADITKTELLVLIANLQMAFEEAGPMIHRLLYAEPGEMDTIPVLSLTRREMQLFQELKDQTKDENNNPKVLFPLTVDEIWLLSSDDEDVVYNNDYIPSDSDMDF